MIDVGNFSLSRLPRIVFGAGSVREVPAVVSEHGDRVLVVTGARSFRSRPVWKELCNALSSQSVVFEDMSVEGEPSPQLVDDAVAHYRTRSINVVVGIGGGSVLDAAKAIAGLLPHGNSVLDHLEGVGRNIPYRGPATPLIAVPTTAGTGSEATKNAVLSVQGEDGYKKSFRHEALVPQVAVVDPELLSSCPPEVIAANGMDAFTQLLESYVSARANPLTDALARSGLEAVRDGLFPAWHGGDSPVVARGRNGMSYAALLSGITLAQVGLGSVHGLASPLGAYFPVPHGVVCGTLVAAATEMNIRALRAREPQHPALDKYAEVGRLIAGTPPSDREEAYDVLVRTLYEWTTRLGIQRLGHYGVKPLHVKKIVAGSRGSSMKTNPIVLMDAEIAEIVQQRL